MTISNPQGMHEYYTDTDRHWHAGSESYTGGDSLLTALRNGWQLLTLAYEQQVDLRGGRCVTVIHFQLVNGSKRMVMPVVENPFIARLLRERRIMVNAIREEYEIETQPDFSNSATYIARA